MPSVCRALVETEKVVGWEYKAEWYSEPELKAFTAASGKEVPGVAESLVAAGAGEGDVDKLSAPPSEQGRGEEKGAPKSKSPGG